jgi:hypothetical protein
MTMMDTIALVVGVALGFVLIHPPSNGPVIAWLTPRQIILFRVVAVLVGMALAVSVVSLARVVIYQRMPRPSEWLSILVSSVLIAGHGFSIQDAFRVFLNDFPVIEDLPLSMIAREWLMGLVLTIPVVSGLLLVRLTRRIFPYWLKTLLLIGCALIAALGPLSVIGIHGADLISPSEGFGPGGGSILYRSALGLIAFLPFGLLFSVPAVAALAERLRRADWKWTEWAGSNASAMVIVSLTLLYRAEFPELTWGWLAERVLLLIWFVVVGLLGRWIVIHIGPAWNRWFGLVPPQDSSTESASSTL